MNLISHYTTAETAINHILCAKRLRFNELKNTNDPWEYKKNIYAQPDKNILKLFKNLKTLDELENHFQNLKSISFTKDFDEKDKRCFSNQLMWANYGKNHKGVCLVFDICELIMLFKEQYSESSFEPRTVKYDDSPKKIVINDSLNERKIIEDLSYRKKMIWNYENEIRFIIEPNEDESYIQNIDSALKAIILGGDFSTKYLCILKKLVKDWKSKPQISKISFNKDGFVFLTEPDDVYLPCPKI